MRWIVMVRDTSGQEFRPNNDTFHSEEDAMDDVPRVKEIYPMSAVFVTQLRGNETVQPWLEDDLR